MVKKITYSRRQPDKRPSPYDFDRARENDDSRKRTKRIHGSDEVQFLTPVPSQQGKKSFVSKKGVFSGPVSIPDEADLEPLPKSDNKHSIFDKVLSNGKCQPAKPDEDILQANRQQFAEMMKTGQRPREYHNQKSKRYLPTPPADVQKRDDQEVQEVEGFVRINGRTDKGKLNTPETSPRPSTRTSQLFEQVVKNEPQKEPYQPRAYKAAPITTPCGTIVGSLLSRESREAQL
jgi:hypothetical protein